MKSYADSISFLETLYRCKLTKEQRAAYMIALQDIPEKSFIATCGIVMKEYKPTAAFPFPAPAVFYEAYEKVKKQKKVKVFKQLPLPSDELASQDDIAQIIREAIRNVTMPPERERGTNERG